MEALADIVGLAASLVLIWYGSVMTVQSARLGSLTIKNLVFPEWWLLGRCRSASRCSRSNSSSASTA